MPEQQYFVYVLTNCSRHPLYTGVTSVLRRGHSQHKDPGPEGDSYTAHYNLSRLVYFERFDYINNALAREKQIKRWSRRKKVVLIERVNPKWDDLSREWGMVIDFEGIVRKAEEKQKT